MRRNQRFVSSDAARRVFAVADEDDGLSPRFVLEPLLAGQVYGVKDRCATADLQVGDRQAQQSRRLGEVLHQRDLPIESQDEGQVLLSENGSQELFRRPLLFLEDWTDAGTRVDEKSESERQLVFAGEVLNLMWLAVFLHDKVIGAEARDQPAVAIRHREKDVDELNADAQRELVVVAGPGRLLSRGRGRGRKDRQSQQEHHDKGRPAFHWAHGNMLLLRLEG